MTRYDARLDEIVAAVQAANPLPATVNELSDGARKALELHASSEGLTPEAALAIMRAERAKDRQLRDTVEGVLAALRANR